jgi:hypothetical protein
LPIEYSIRIAGNLKAVQISIEDWKKLEGKINKHEQAFQVKEDLIAAFAIVLMKGDN